jgi:hypothetical protein
MKAPGTHKRRTVAQTATVLALAAFRASNSMFASEQLQHMIYHM